jgi:hypothetical protein
MAIEALEQQSEDCISRADAKKYLSAPDANGDRVIYESDLDLLPPVQPKTGHWIYGENEYGIDGYHCDKCGFFVPWDYAHKFINYIKDYKFCPKCNARMVELQESEEK